MKKANRKKAKSTTAEYKVWSWMKARCLCENAGNYKYYGGRGIKICERWLVFENFLADMGKRPKGMSLDRIDVDGDYTPENCKWSSQKEQTQNTRKSRIITHDGETKNISEWSRSTGISIPVIHSRINSGMPLDEVFNPINRKSGKPLKANNRTREIGGKYTNHVIKVDNYQWLRLKSICVLDGCDIMDALDNAVKDIVSKYIKIHQLDK